MVVLRTFLATAALVVAPALGQSNERLETFFLPDSEPTSLVASVKSIGTVSGDVVTTLEVACPTPSSPENEACREAGIYPAEVYHTQGSVWGGTTTYSIDDSTTTWRCELGGGLGGKQGLDARCSKTIESSGSTRTESTTYDNCYCIAHLLPMVVTANADLLGHYVPFTPITGDDGSVTVRDASWLNAQYSENIASSNCPASQTTMWAGAVAAAKTDRPNPGSSPTTAAPSSETGSSTDESPENTGIKGVGSVPTWAWLFLTLLSLALTFA
ncbi:hypothetical protein jhhlp_003047 [Lomentospora prolificans]|uniref:Ig-like domain-containing protein n=1 Tax=Lomentospora prolificans TaxID=41688 RepID=A0A2N3NFT8_9PEZI|nr:hypothetical protein jhhlp_003047 [Lomentospora prolificans]